MKYNLLIADPDVQLTLQLANYLLPYDFETNIVHDGEHALKTTLNGNFHALITELSLPKYNGLDLLKSLRAHTQIPVIILTTNRDSVNRLLCFQNDANAYLQKPCNPLEILIQLQSLIRTKKDEPLKTPLLSSSSLQLNRTMRTAHISQKLLDLTNTEFNLLEILLKSPGQAYSKEELTEYAIGRKYTAYDRSIDVHISHLRTKLGTHPNGQPWIITMRGFGYALAHED